MTVILIIAFGAFLLISFFVFVLLALRHFDAASKMQNTRYRPKPVQKKISVQIFILNIFLVSLFFLLGGLLFYTVSKIKIIARQGGYEHLASLDIESSEQKTAQTKSQAEEGISATGFRALESNAPENTNVIFFGSSFSPATIAFSSDKKQEDKKEGTSPFQNPDVFSSLTNAAAGDIFIMAFYDQMEGGKFIQSPSLEFIQPYDETKELLGVELRLPPFKAGQIIQLPLLLKGRVLAEYADDNSYILNGNGKLELLKDIAARYSFSYAIKRSGSPASFTLPPVISNWLYKEFSDMPKPLKHILLAHKQSSDAVKLGITALILNGYFGYQAGFEDVTLPPGQTWNSFLADYVSSNRRLLCDCDVLATYAYIYLKFLGLHPVLLIGYFNSQESPDVLKNKELHATLYLQTDDRWIIFEPTLFTKGFDVAYTMREGDSPNHAAMQQTQKTEFQNTLNNSAVAYFSLPEEIRSLLKEDTMTSVIEDDHVNELTHNAAALAAQQTPESSSRQTTEENNKTISAARQTSLASAALFIVAVALLFLFNALKKEHTPLLALTHQGRYAYAAMMITALFYLVGKSFTTAGKLPMAGQFVSYAGLLFSAAAALLALLSLLLFLLRRRTAIIRLSLLLASGCFVVSSALCNPSPAAYWVLLIMIVLIVGKRKNFLKPTGT